MAKKQKCIKGIKFGDRQNMKDSLISTGVSDVEDNKDMDTDYATKPSENNKVYNAGVDNLDNEHAEDESIDDEDMEDIKGAEVDENEDSNVVDNNDEVAIENRDDEFAAEPVEDGVTRTRSGRISHPYNWADKFPETAHYQMDNKDGRWV